MSRAWSTRRSRVLELVRAGGGSPVSWPDLAAALGCSWRSVRSDTDWLERKGYVARVAGSRPPAFVEV